MTESTKTEYNPLLVSPPGETLAETLEELGMSQTELARRMGRPTKTINEIVQGKTAILPETAFQLENVLGIPASFWLARETAYRTSLARSVRQNTVVAPETIEWAKQFPCKEMAQLGWIESCAKKAEYVQGLFEFFRVASVQAWEATWNRPEVAFRRSLTKDGNRHAVSAWLRRGEIEAASKKAAPYDADRFRAALEHCRSLTAEAPEVFDPAIQKACAAAGVIVLFVRELPSASVSGAARWLTTQRALIQLTLRFKTDDQLWFSFFHEAGHVLLHPKKGIFVDDGHGSSTQEKEADAFASNMLIPDEVFDTFSRVRPFSAQRVQAFAAQEKIAPGIVVGRLQHEHLLPFNQLNGLKRGLTWADSK
ncbi:MAG TPA: HigA family addiction module antitoxin [Thermoanaerobaculia bacterium]|nr:HigA family addiction module antitoxin [Thermoanaerobaculia bacterium]